MEILTYALTLLISFLGILIGIIVSNMAIEEMRNTSTYLKYLNIIIIPLTIFVASYNINKLYTILFACIILIMLILFREKYSNVWVYPCMGAILYVSTKSQETLNVATLIFIYGISVATIDTSIHFKKKINGQITISNNIPLIKNIFSKYWYYLLVGIVFYVIFSIVL